MYCKLMQCIQSANDLNDTQRKPSVILNLLSLYYRPEDLQKALLTYDYLVLGRRRNNSAIVAMIVFGSEIDTIDGKQYNLLRVNRSTCLLNLFSM